MSNRIHALAQQITGKAGLEECSIEELQQIAHRYPYFAPAQFLLLQKLRQAGTAEEAGAQYQKAVLFYHDPLLFEHFIASNKFYVEEVLGPDKIESNSFDHEVDEADISDPVEDFPVSEQPAEQKEFLEEDHRFNEQEADTTEKQEKNTVSQYASEPLIATEPTPEPVIVEEQLTESAMEGQPVEATEPDITPPPSTDSQKSTEPEKSSASTELAFEPFHTVDYFASQGIRISLEEVPKDKLGKQLKSFTQWLKTMKRLPAAQLADNMESSVEKKVESMASHSVSESDVVTEAMAEVWLKQGNNGKALDIYNKLSLLNPSKKAYFAAKIENLKPS
ncbi:MAG TPA: hypothetical protein VF609_02030 [Flavisolibacter sp.]